jgi:probable rRNA maturation factor
LIWPKLRDNRWVSISDMNIHSRKDIQAIIDDFKQDDNGIEFGYNKRAMEINVLIEEGLETEVDSDWLQKVVENALTAENMPPNVEISLLITDQERMRQLNLEYRGLDRPTDVLSFSMSEAKEGEEPQPFIGPPDGCLHLGEVIVSYPQAVLQAQDQKHSIGQEMAVLITHGVLHILGYDHATPEEEAVMFRRQREILTQSGKELE